MKRARQSAAWAAFLLAASVSGLPAQTDYYNTDRSRPTRIEDAHATERYAVEIKVAPLRIDQEPDGGFSRWSFHPEASYGVLPRTSIEVGLPVEALGDEPAGFTGLELSLFHNLNVETLTLPALAIRADLVVPFEPEGGSAVRPALTGILTRTVGRQRIHLNGRYAWGEISAGDAPADEDTRWLTGVAVDRVFPLRALLLIAEAYARGDDGFRDAEWVAGGGVRYQVSPYLALDAGAGRTLTGDSSWHVTFGSALHLGIRALVPGGDR